MLVFHIIMLLVAVLAAIVCITSIVTASKSDGEFIGQALLFLLNICLVIYWGVKINEDLAKPEKQEVTIKTNVRPRVDYVVTNNTDTLYVYTFNKNEILK